jgi:hypothetical protein
MNEFQRQFRRITLPRAVLFVVMLFCSLVDMPGNYHPLGGSGPSGLGVGTIVIAGLIWAVFLIRPVLPGFVLKSLAFLVLFEIYASGTMLWSGTGIDGIQLLLVGIAFLGLIVVCARESAIDPQSGIFISRAMLLASVIGVLMYLSVAAGEKKLGESLDPIIHPRPFALFAITIVAVSLSRWRASDPAKPSSLVPLAWAALTTFTVALSMSRTALVCCVGLFPLAILLRLNLKSLVQALLVLGAGGFLFVSAILAYKPLYDRFVGYDASMHVAGMTVNASGRTAIWDTLLRSIGDDWMFGKGEAASEILIRRKFNGLIAQPHNDYLRFYYDTGIVGLALWLCFAGVFYARTTANLRYSVRERTADYPLHVAALLAFSAVSWSMLTDNSICYSFVMMPLGMVMGCSLGAGLSHFSGTANQGFEAIFSEPFAQPARRNIRSV